MAGGILDNASLQSWTNSSRRSGISTAEHNTSSTASSLESNDLDIKDHNNESKGPRKYGDWYRYICSFFMPLIGFGFLIFGLQMFPSNFYALRSKVDKNVMVGGITLCDPNRCRTRVPYFSKTREKNNIVALMANLQLNMPWIFLLAAWICLLTGYFLPCLLLFPFRKYWRKVFCCNTYARVPNTGHKGDAKVKSIGRKIVVLLFNRHNIQSCLLLLAVCLVFIATMGLIMLATIQGAEVGRVDLALSCVVCGLLIIEVFVSWSLLKGGEKEAAHSTTTSELPAQLLNSPEISEPAPAHLQTKSSHAQRVLDLESLGANSMETAGGLAPPGGESAIVRRKTGAVLPEISGYVTPGAPSNANGVIISEHCLSTQGSQARAKQPLRQSLASDDQRKHDEMNRGRYRIQDGLGNDPPNKHRPSLWRELGRVNGTASKKSNQGPENPEPIPLSDGDYGAVIGKVNNAEERMSYAAAALLAAYTEHGTDAHENPNWPREYVNKKNFPYLLDGEPEELLQRFLAQREKKKEREEKAHGRSALADPSKSGEGVVGITPQDESLAFASLGNHPIPSILTEQLRGVPRNLVGTEILSNYVDGRGMIMGEGSMRHHDDDSILSTKQRLLSDKIEPKPELTMTHYEDVDAGPANTSSLESPPVHKNDQPNWQRTTEEVGTGDVPIATPAGRATLEQDPQVALEMLEKKGILYNEDTRLYTLNGQVMDQKPGENSPNAEISSAARVREAREFHNGRGQVDATTGVPYNSLPTSPRREAWRVGWARRREGRRNKPGDNSDLDDNKASTEYPSDFMDDRVRGRDPSPPGNPYVTHPTPNHPTGGIVPPTTMTADAGNTSIGGRSSDMPPGSDRGSIINHGDSVVLDTTHPDNTAVTSDDIALHPVDDISTGNSADNDAHSTPPNPRRRPRGTDYVAPTIINLTPSPRQNSADDHAVVQSPLPTADPTQALRSLQSQENTGARMDERTSRQYLGIYYPGLTDVHMEDVLAEFGHWLNSAPARALEDLQVQERGGARMDEYTRRIYLRDNYPELRGEHRNNVLADFNDWLNSVPARALEDLQERALSGATIDEHTPRTYLRDNDLEPRGENRNNVLADVNNWLRGVDDDPDDDRGSTRTGGKTVRGRERHGAFDVDPLRGRFPSRNPNIDEDITNPYHPVVPRDSLERHRPKGAPTDPPVHPGADARSLDNHADYLPPTSPRDRQRDPLRYNLRNARGLAVTEDQPFYTADGDRLTVPAGAYQLEDDGTWVDRGKVHLEPFQGGLVPNGWLAGQKRFDSSRADPYFANRGFDGVPAYREPLYDGTQRPWYDSRGADYVPALGGNEASGYGGGNVPYPSFQDGGGSYPYQSFRAADRGYPYQSFQDGGGSNPYQGYGGGSYPYQGGNFPYQSFQDGGVPLSYPGDNYPLQGGGGDMPFQDSYPQSQQYDTAAPPINYGEDQPNLQPLPTYPNDFNPQASEGYDSQYPGEYNPQANNDKPGNSPQPDFGNDSGYETSYSPMPAADQKQLDADASRSPGAYSTFSDYRGEKDPDDVYNDDAGEGEDEDENENENEEENDDEAGAENDLHGQEGQTPVNPAQSAAQQALQPDAYEATAGLGGGEHAGWNKEDDLPKDPLPKAAVKQGLVTSQGSDHEDPAGAEAEELPLMTPAGLLGDAVKPVRDERKEPGEDGDDGVDEGDRANEDGDGVNGDDGNELQDLHPEQHSGRAAAGKVYGAEPEQPGLSDPDDELSMDQDGNIVDRWGNPVDTGAGDPRHVDDNGVPIASHVPQSNQCGICRDTLIDEQPEDPIVELECGDCFCKDCWTSYLEADTAWKAEELAQNALGDVVTQTDGSSVSLDVQKICPAQGCGRPLADPPVSPDELHLGPPGQIEQTRQHEPPSQLGLLAHGLTHGQSPESNISALSSPDPAPNVTDEDGEGEFRTCAICQELEQPQKLVILQLCKHAFHSDCLSRFKVSVPGRPYTSPSNTQQHEGSLDADQQENILMTIRHIMRNYESAKKAVLRQGEESNEATQIPCCVPACDEIYPCDELAYYKLDDPRSWRRQTMS